MVYPYGVPDQKPDRIRPQFRLGAKFAMPWNGVDDTPPPMKKLAGLPGLIGLIDPSTLVTIPGVGQVLRCVVSGAVYIDPAGGSTLSTKGSGKMITMGGSASFKPDLGKAITMPLNNWTAIYVVKPDSSFSGINYLFSKIVADASEGRADFSIGFNNLKVVEFDHNPAATSQIISAYTFGANDYKVVAVSQSAARGMTISINGVVSHNVPGANAGLSSVAVERMFQIGNYGAGSSAYGFRGDLGLSGFFEMDFHDPNFTAPLTMTVAAMKDLFAI